jgi:hypothetical protein
VQVILDRARADEQLRRDLRVGTAVRVAGCSPASAPTPITARSSAGQDPTRAAGIGAGEEAEEPDTATESDSTWKLDAPATT